jgi:hypothetical protein
VLLAKEGGFASLSRKLVAGRGETLVSSSILIDKFHEKQIGDSVGDDVQAPIVESSL